MRSIPLGAYVGRTSPIHAVDARSKLVLLLSATVAAFATRHLPGIVLLGSVLVALLVVSHAGLGSVLRAIRPTLVILVFSLVANAFVADGTADVALVGSFGISWGGLVRGALAVERIVLLVGYALVVSATTTPPELSDGLAAVGRPLERLGVPVDDLAMTVSIALRFVPVCAEEFDRIECAQRARGAHLEEGGPIERLRAYGAVLTPLMIALFRRADEVADAMRDRCYRGEGRTRLTPPFSAVDALWAAGSVAVCVVACLL